MSNDPARAAAQSVWAPHWSLLDSEGKLTEAANAALRPVRAILDQLAADTEPPCNHAAWVYAHRQAINDISVYVYPEPNQ